MSELWSASLLAGGHRQTRSDRDDDGWADLAGYGRGIVRPRLFWDGGNGQSGFVTAGMTYENRDGGTMTDAVLPATGLPYVESLDTRRYDIGGTAQTLLKGQFVLTARVAAAWQRHEHTFGDVVERDRHDTVFTELAIRGAKGRHTWVAGAAYERDAYDPRDVPRFRYTYDVPGVFVQDDIDVASWMSLSAGGRADFHSAYGTFFSPRVAALFRASEWTSRIAIGRGFFASTPLTEETEAAGLTRLTIVRPLEAERGTSTSIDLTRAIGPASVTATVFASRIAHPVTVDREDLRVVQRLGGNDQRRPGVSDDRATWTAGRHGELHLRAIAGAERRQQGRIAVDAAPQRRPGRYVGRRGCGSRWPRGVLHRASASRGEPVPLAITSVRHRRRPRRAPRGARAPLHQRGEHHRRPPDSLGLANPSHTGR